MFTDLINAEDLPKLPGIMFETDDIAVQMSVFMAITGMVTYAALFVVNMIGRSAKRTLFIVLEQVFLASFGLFLTITGVIVYTLIEEMELAFQVLSISMLVSHGILGVLYLLAKVKQMNRVAHHATGADAATSRVRSFRHVTPANNEIMEITRNDRYTYRFVNPGENIGNDVMIPPNMMLSPNMFGPPSLTPTYSEPYRALRSTEPISASSSLEAGTVADSNGVSITEQSDPTPSSSRRTSAEPSELSPCISSPPVPQLRLKSSTPFRVHPATFRKEPTEPIPSATEPVPSTSGLSFADQSKPPLPARRPVTFKTEPEPKPSTSRVTMPSTLLDAAPNNAETYRNRRSKSTPTTSSSETVDPAVAYKSGDDYVIMSSIKK